MGEVIPDPKFNIGDHVIVRHHDGMEWTGYVTWRNLTDLPPDGDWEYEVTNAPLWRAAREDGERWRPLAWESEMEKVK